MSDIRIEIDARQLGQLFDGILTRLGNTRTVMEQIGEDLVRSTDERWDEQVSPEGRPWPPLAPRTVAAKRAKGQRPEILRRTDWLRRSIAFEVQGDVVRVGTPVSYARKMQFGGKFRIGATVVLVPARPFLGLTASDRLAAIERVRVFARLAVRGS